VQSVLKAWTITRGRGGNPELMATTVDPLSKVAVAIEGAPSTSQGAANWTPRPPLHFGSDIPGVAVKLAGSRTPISEGVDECEDAAAAVPPSGAVNNVVQTMTETATTTPTAVGSIRRRSSPARLWNVMEMRRTWLAAIAAVNRDRVRALRPL